MPTSRATPIRRQGSARPKASVSNHMMDEDTVGTAAPLALGTEVMRRCGVSEARESGLAHLRGRVVRLEGSRVVVAWGKDGREETLSRRRAQTFADAFQRLPETHEFRRRASRGLSTSNKPRRSRKRRNEPEARGQKQESLPASAVASRRRRGPVEISGGEQPPFSLSQSVSVHKRRSEPEALDEEQEPPTSIRSVRKKRLSAPEASGVGQAAAHSVEIEQHQEQSRFTHEAAPTGDLSLKRQTEGSSARKRERAMRSKNAVEQLRYRKAEPGQRIEWHGGQGFGTSAEAWVNVGDGKFRTRHDIESTSTQRLRL